MAIFSLNSSCPRAAAKQLEILFVYLLQLFLCLTLIFASKRIEWDDNSIMTHETVVLKVSDFLTKFEL